MAETIWLRGTKVSMSLVDLCVGGCGSNHTLVNHSVIWMRYLSGSSLYQCLCMEVKDPTSGEDVGLQSEHCHFYHSLSRDLYAWQACLSMRHSCHPGVHTPSVILDTS